MIKSKALEINLARTQVEVAIDPRFDCLQEIVAPYFGLLQGMNLFLKELSHPFKNWHFIVENTHSYALNYFHLMKSHPRGPEAARCLVEIFNQALNEKSPEPVKIDAADHLIQFLHHIIKTADAEIGRFQGLLAWAFDAMHKLSENLFVLIVRSYFPIKRLGADYIQRLAGSGADFDALNRLLIRSADQSLAYWLAVSDPLNWFMAETGANSFRQELEALFVPVSRSTLTEQIHRLTRIRDRHRSVPAGEQHARELLALSHHSDIAREYRAIPQKLQRLQVAAGQGAQWKMLFLFRIMNIDGLALLHEDTLREINRTMDQLIVDQSIRNIRELLRATFAILRSNMDHYPAAALNCVLSMGRGIYATQNDELIDAFVDATIGLGFQRPDIGGVGNDWQIKVNPAHILNIRTWLELIELDPKRSTRLLSNLIVQLAVGGVFIRDMDLFGRDISKLLNSPVKPIYNLIKQLARLFPVYFNEIGAEGELRDISTQIDEICHRRDPLIHFLRKQSHVEGSHRILSFMQAALHFWITRDKSTLAPYLPPNIFDQVETHGPFIDGVHAVLSELSPRDPDAAIRWLTGDRQRIRLEIGGTSSGDAVDRERVILFAELYRQMDQKYNLAFTQIESHIEHLPSDAFPDLIDLKSALQIPDLKTRIDKLLDHLESLKKTILSPQSYPAREDIYKKRHFTVDIPSMYGSYREPKFDAMGLTLRLEALVNVLFEELIQTIDLSLITKATCYQIYDRLVLFDKALKIDGIASAELHHQMELLAHSLRIRGFSFTQYLDIYKGFAQAVKNVINDYFNNVHGEHLTRILTALEANQIQKRFFPPDGDCDFEKLCHRTSEIFFRDRLTLSLGLQQLDLFFTRILTTLFNQSSKLPKDKLRRLLNYDPQRAITSLQNVSRPVTGIIDLGNKGLNMIKLKNLNLPVPPGFIITTEVFRCREIIESFSPAQENFRDQVVQHIRELESCTGKRLGDTTDPLLFSVRSGSSISQPGMMDTFLNVGINESIAQGLADRSGNPWYAWDSYRRFLQCYGMSLGLKRDDFDAIISEFKEKLGIPLKKGFTGQQMQQVACAYKERILSDGFTIPEAPLSQLHETIRSVMDSWQSGKAQAYRRIMGISDDWGTAVTVQAMVFGNLSQRSGSGVIFTHNPRWSGDSLSLWGDFSVENQGEDVVSGLVRTLPISVKQQEHEMRETDITLETHFPEIYNTMRDWARVLIDDHGWSPQEMEFTFESPSTDRLYLLQTRDMAIRESKRVLTFDPSGPERHAFLGHGIGVSGGAMSGRIVFTLEEIERWRRNEPGTALILARGDTVPDDIQEIFAADGLLTARGGVTSHASVVAHRLGKTCVVGCGNLICDEKNLTVTFAQTLLKSGEFISIDGREGSVYQGAMKIKPH
jgi:pyruvate,orthophosphate dikinase